MSIIVIASYCVLMQMVVIYVPFLNEAFGTTPLSFGAWLECVGLSFAVLVASELYKLVARAIDKSRGTVRV